VSFIKLETLVLFSLFQGSLQAVENHYCPLSFQHIATLHTDLNA